ncbi:putative nucleoside-diphosphate-sugar epimerase protein [Botrytis fragariae]|uniref:Putative nucleoside-diphosphate-sugar epimerase protein n=1 Tax=Botrytis fragariae TaxID=1964551 RepID=A0A8H6AIQ0_9HELO|nr:putative nucleoside-diphosphate-sugar epimerase protein [Botrytis fragariae]KAF5867995.1 putative nucleoside-diphosphate-sugar epimerase protein [Botrytis fragariae]
MKLIIVGSTDILGQELVKQALDNIEITSIIAISGHDTDSPQEPSGHSKLVTCALPEYNEGWERLNIDASATGACIWNIKPIMKVPRYLNVYHDQVKYLNETQYGVEWMVRRREAHFENPASPGVTPLRFIYVSALQAIHQRTNQVPTSLSIQGLAEERVLSSAEDLGGQVQACIAKPGRIVRPRTGNILKEMVHTAGSWVRDGLKGRLPRIQADKVAAALLDRAITGNHPETLHNRDLIRIGGMALKGPKGSVTGGKVEQTSEQAEETGEQAEAAGEQVEDAGEQVEDAGEQVEDAGEQEEETGEQEEETGKQAEQTVQPV